MVSLIDTFVQQSHTTDGNTKPFNLRGKQFSREELEVITWCVQEFFSEGRTKISVAICETLDWKQPNGWLKDRACRDVLLELEKLGLITLPPSRSTRTPVNSKSRQTTNYLAKYDLISPITSFPNDISLEFSKGNQNEKIWNELVREYHYLGHETVVGRCIKYLVKSEDRLLGALAFSSPAYRLAPRDSVLHLLGIDPSKVRDLVINNSRFLILPNAKVKNLASSVLSLATNKIVQDWQQYYALTPLIVETFIQPSKYSGTCYKAANWFGIGLTQGYAKKGYRYYNSQEPKLIFLYGLNRQVRRKLSTIVVSKKEE